MRHRRAPLRGGQEPNLSRASSRLFRAGPPHPAVNGAMCSVDLVVRVVLLGAILLAFRISHDRMARELERTRSRAELLEQVARVFLSIRDRANTPLQTMKIAASLLRTKHPEAV